MESASYQYHWTPFPYERLRSELETLPGISLHAKDFTQMIAFGRRIGWSEEMIAAHERLAASGRSMDITQDVPPFLAASLFENNAFFSFADHDHEEQCLAVLEDIASRLALQMRVQ